MVVVVAVTIYPTKKLSALHPTKTVTVPVSTFIGWFFVYLKLHPTEK